MSYDWIIASMPRSGTHMLATALDSHPDLQCIGEPGASRYHDLWSGEGRLKGAIIMYPDLKLHLETPKIIALVRSLPSLSEAMLRQPRHYFEPGQVDNSRRTFSYIDLRRLVKQWVSMIDTLADLPREQVLWVDYLQLTRGYNISVLPDSLRIQEFLGVEPRILRPKTYKPRVDTVTT